LPPEKKHGPNPKGVAGSKFVNGEERGQNPKGWPVSQSDGERLKVVEFGEQRKQEEEALSWWLLSWLQEAKKKKGSK